MNSIICDDCLADRDTLESRLVTFYGHLSGIIAKNTEDTIL